MGTYDYLTVGDIQIQVKCFYRPIFTQNDYIFVSYDERYEIFNSGGNFNNYCLNDELPLKTLYYEYPKNCYIYLNTFSNFEDYSFAEVKDGKLAGFISTTNELKYFLPLIDRHGTKIKVTSIEDIKEYEENLKTWNSLLKPYLYKEEEKEFSKYFINRWYTEKSKIQEIGEYVHCLFETTKDGYRDELVLQSMTVLTNMISDFKKDHPDVYYEFFTKNGEWKL